LAGDEIAQDIAEQILRHLFIRRHGFGECDVNGATLPNAD